MRIISGKYKGKRITVPKKAAAQVRPTTDYAKESLFNILNNYYSFEEITVVDLFAGTGNISYEFASRGCKDILAVDKNTQCIKYIEKTANSLVMPIKTLKNDVFMFLKHLSMKADIIFADPPYAMTEEAFALIPQLVFENKLLHPEGLLIIEHAKQTDLSHLYYYSHTRKYGSSVFSFFKLSA
ncbi:RsmD family RNA methyltransferase [Leptobacterium sp. I13]|uniref:RsmD family RNA methyltransferase n=1 Tax=Leptobacterium meishanense TaxID=3128904 RepID=UPI0030EDEBD5